MFGLGLSFAEKVLNHYAYDMKPSIKKMHTQNKMRAAFPEIDNYLSMGREDTYADWINLGQDKKVGKNVKC